MTISEKLKNMNDSELSTLIGDFFIDVTNYYDKGGHNFCDICPIKNFCEGTSIGCYGAISEWLNNDVTETYAINVKNGQLLISDSLFKDILKKPVLALKVNNEISKLASFNNKESMEKFLKCFGGEVEE